MHSSLFSSVIKSIYEYVNKDCHFSMIQAMKDRGHQTKLSNTSSTKNGNRVLFLDGGGMRGLIQIEVLSHISEMTGRSIPDLFDWIVGTSTGGIVALALVYRPLTKRNAHCTC